MPINLTNVYGRLNNVRRNLFYDPELTLRLYDINRLLLEIDTDWYLRLDATTSAFAVGAEYHELFIADTDEERPLRDIIPVASAAEINGERYKISHYERPRGITQLWTLRLESTGMRGSP